MIDSDPYKASHLKEFYYRKIIAKLHTEQKVSLKDKTILIPARAFPMPITAGIGNEKRLSMQ